MISQTEIEIRERLKHTNRLRLPEDIEWVKSQLASPLAPIRELAQDVLDETEEPEVLIEALEVLAAGPDKEPEWMADLTNDPELTDAVQALKAADADLTQKLKDLQHDLGIDLGLDSGAN